MTAQIRLPGRAEPLVIPEPGWAARYPPPILRRVYAAAHVAARRTEGLADPVIDWESTMKFRRHLWAYGFGVAEAMDTAQRGMGLSWEQARELIARSAEEATRYRADQSNTGLGAGAGAGVDAGTGGALVCGVGTDQLIDGERYAMARVIDAYAEQMAFVQATGAGVIVMASRALAGSARGARDYLEVYGELLRQAERPVILHWLGEAFDPALRGYWGGSDFDAAADTVLELIERAGGQVGGIKLSVLDARREVALRRRLPAGVRMYTGDDFHYADLIRGDAAGPANGDRRHDGDRPHDWDGRRHGDGRRDGVAYSDALLGAFAAITAPAAAALAALDRGDVAGYDATMGPTVPLSRLIFEAPTYYYKVGVAFLAWLNGLQPDFAMLGGLQRRRSARHLIRVFELAAAARALTDPELAVARMGEMVAVMAGPGRV